MTLLCNVTGGAGPRLELAAVQNPFCVAAGTSKVQVSKPPAPIMQQRVQAA